MSLLFVRAYLQLIRFELDLWRDDFKILYAKVRDCSVRTGGCKRETIDHICSVVEQACAWYPKQVLCLQRSAAAVVLLRDYGAPAHLVIGAQQLPFKAHAWVEVDGRVVNDKPYAADIYAVLDRC